jgi:hypothetical protein
VTHDRVRPPARHPARRRLRGFGVLVLALGLLVEPGLVAAHGGRGGDPGLTSSVGGALRVSRPGVAGPSDADPGPGADPTSSFGAVDLPTDLTSTAVGRDPASVGTDEPSVMALDAAAHVDDRIAFTPGARVSVPFTPRPDDGWAVDGLAPRRLPAGAATGRSLLASRQGSIWSPASSAPQATQPLAPAGRCRPIPRRR